MAAAAAAAVFNVYTHVALQCGFPARVAAAAESGGLTEGEGGGIEGMGGGSCRGSRVGVDLFPGDQDQGGKAGVRFGPLSDEGMLKGRRENGRYTKSSAQFRNPISAPASATRTFSPAKEYFYARA